MRLSRAALGAATGVFLVAAAGAALSAAAGGQQERAAVARAPHPRPHAGHYRVNDRGQTYGKLNIRSADKADQPDLVAVVASNGVEGYCYYAQLSADPNANPSSPAEALRIQAHERDRTIPVYVSDGTTRVGSFTISAGGSTGMPRLVHRTH